MYSKQRGVRANCNLNRFQGEEGEVFLVSYLQEQEKMARSVCFQHRHKAVVRLSHKPKVSTQIRNNLFLREP